MPFRAAFSALIVAPTAAILLLYLKFHVLLWQRDLLVAHNNMSTLSRQNIRCECCGVADTFLTLIQSGASFLS